MSKVPLNAQHNLLTFSHLTAGTQSSATITKLNYWGEELDKITTPSNYLLSSLSCECLKQVFLGSRKYVEQLLDVRHLYTSTKAQEPCVRISAARQGSMRDPQSARNKEVLCRHESSRRCSSEQYLGATQTLVIFLFQLSGYWFLIKMQVFTGTDSNQKPRDAEVRIQHIQYFKICIKLTITLCFIWYFMTQLPLSHFLDFTLRWGIKIVFSLQLPLKDMRNWQLIPSANESPVKSTAVVKYSAVQRAASFAQLQCNTDLNLPPSNWLSSTAESYGLQHVPTHSTGFSRWLLFSLLCRLWCRFCILSCSFALKNLILVLAFGWLICFLTVLAKWMLYLMQKT